MFVIHLIFHKLLYSFLYACSSKENLDIIKLSVSSFIKSSFAS